MTPTARSLLMLRADGYTAAVVEKWIPQTRRRCDLFGCIDILAIKPGWPMLGVQATSGSNVSARASKARDEPRLSTWLECGGAYEVWGWAKRGPRGKRKTWTVRRVAVDASNPRHSSGGESLTAGPSSGPSDGQTAPESTA